MSCSTQKVSLLPSKERHRGKRIIPVQLQVPTKSFDEIGISEHLKALHSTYGDFRVKVSWSKTIQTRTEVWRIPTSMAIGIVGTATAYMNYKRLWEAEASY